MIGQTISHYKITAMLGGGGMGVVYKAIDTKLDRPVALKFLPPELTRDADAKRRFVHEAKAASALQHHNICTIHEIDETPDGHVFIAMDCYEGETLRQKISRGPLPIDEAVDIAVQVAKGLAEAHEAGIVHRDIKPANIMLTEKGVAKILDFGLAKLTGQTKVTRTGTTVGTVAYMSPEQAAGRDIDQRSDVFSLGIVLYEMLTGEVPFKGDHEAAVLYGIVNSEPDPIAGCRSGVSEGLQRIVGTALQKEAKRRYRNASEMAVDLDRFRRGISTTAYRETGRRHFRRGLTAAVILVVAVAAAYFVRSRFITPGSHQTKASRIMIAVLPFDNLGPPDEEYFADGVTEEITARLAGVSEFGVIARTSSMQYKNTEKAIGQIGGELGVDFILEGTIRWQRSPAAESRIRVTPQLIRVSDATHVWADIYDEPVTEIFDVQAGIANRVIDALGVTLLGSERESLESKPTDNFEAYNHYLGGWDYQTRSYTAADQRHAEEEYEKAIELDDRFAMAYARLSEVHSEIYFQKFDASTERASMAKDAAERALQIDPGLPEAHKALGKYYYSCHLDYDRAIEHYEIAAAGLANDSGLMASIGFVQRRRGEWKKALASIGQAAELDPRSALLAAEVGGTYCLLREYENAERFFDRAVSLDPEVPDFYFWFSDMYLMWDGNTERARRIVQMAFEHVDADDIVGLLLRLDILDGDYEDALSRLSTVSTETVGRRELSFRYYPRVQCVADVYRLVGDQRLAHTYQDSARVLIESKIRQKPNDPHLHAALGIAYAGLGESDGAIREGKRAVELLPVSKDAFTGYDRAVDLARIYTMVGEHDAAIDQLEYLLAIPGALSARLLQLDPCWAGLYDHPRFRELIRKHKANDA